jgi:hypothetical protein
MSTSSIQGPRSFRREVAPGVYVVADAIAERNRLGDWAILVTAYRWDRGDPEVEFDQTVWPALYILSEELVVAHNTGGTHRLFARELDKWADELARDDEYADQQAEWHAGRMTLDGGDTNVR